MHKHGVDEGRVGVGSRWSQEDGGSGGDGYGGASVEGVHIK